MSQSNSGWVKTITLGNSALKYRSKYSFRGPKLRFFAIFCLDLPALMTFSLSLSYLIRSNYLTILIKTNTKNNLLYAPHLPAYFNNFLNSFSFPLRFFCIVLLIWITTETATTILTQELLRSRILGIASLAASLIVLMGCSPSGTGGNNKQRDTILSYDIVDTDQTLCYDSNTGATQTCSGLGYDADYSGNQPDYSVTDSGLTVTDNVTDLVWQQSTDSDGNGSIEYPDKMTRPDLLPIATRSHLPAKPTGVYPVLKNTV